jgi:hypothetical protein
MRNLQLRDAQCQLALLRYIFACQPDSSGFPEGLLDQRFERWVNERLVQVARFSVLVWLVIARGKPAKAGFDLST